MRTIVIVVMLAACGAEVPRPSTTARPPASPAASARAVSAPVPAPRAPRVVVGDPHQRVFENTQQRRLAAHAVDIAESDLWSPCLRDFVRAQDDVARRMLTLAFARLEVDCDKDGRVVLGPPHGYRGRTHVGFHATFAGADTQAALRVAVCDAGRPRGEQVVLELDGRRLPLPRLDFTRDLDGCYVAELPPSLTLERTLPDLFIADDVVVRFAEDEIEDVVVSHEMLRDMRLAFDAVDAIAAR